MAYRVKHFLCEERPLFVSELGHSSYKESKRVGPWSRAIFILHLVVRGYADFSGFRAEAGQVFLIAKDRLHSFTTSEDYEHYWIGFGGETVGTLFAAFGIEHREHKLFRVEDADFAKSLFSLAMERASRESDEGGETAVLSVLAALLPLLRSGKMSAAPHKTDYAERALLFIKNNYMYPIKMEDISKELYISEKYMYRLFLDRFHVSPQKYLKATRMRVAKELLLQGALSVAEIAQSVGYASLSVFSKVFKEYYGESPSAARKSKK
jgi:AraC family transcriptional regulator of arabinose operon